MSKLDRLVDMIYAAGNSKPDREQAAAAVSSAARILRAELEAAVFDGPPKVLTYAPSTFPAGSASSTADRLRFRFNDLHCAKVLGTPEDVERVIAETVSEVEAAALSRWRT